ncbi:MAG: hypothetical protein H6765_09135 [Candidatus Peribacteria bacterium]|nr:MAG: hypothetical protein H6765_09135 [Candidatus Peribacteria bacterium]
MSKTSREKFSKTDKIFKLQAYASKVFNEYAEKRTKNNKVLDGDILTWIQEGRQQFGIYAAETQMVTPCASKNQNRELFLCRSPWVHHYLMWPNRW